MVTQKKITGLIFGALLSFHRQKLMFISLVIKLSMMLLNGYGSHGAKTNKKFFLAPIERSL